MISTFGAAIILGTLLLTLPLCRKSTHEANWLISFFIATSATCVTGLEPVPISEYFTVSGQVVILLLMQFGGLGIMTLGAFLFEILGRQLSIREESALTNSMGFSIGRIRQLLLQTIWFTAIWELAGTIILSLQFIFRYGYPVPKAFYYGVFHAVSAFCNAGFSLFSDSLTGFHDDPLMLATIAVLVLVGGIGFLVHNNLLTAVIPRRDGSKDRRLYLHTRIVLLGTSLLIAIGVAVLLLFEWNNGLSHLAPHQRIYAAFFTVSCRTAGFSLVDVANLQGLSKAVIMLLMFVGGAPGSTAGGIKVTTVAVLLATVAAMMRNRDETEFGMRTIPLRVVREAFVLATLGVTMVALVSLSLNLTEAANPALVPPHGLSAALLFETISAFGTAGVSFGTTSALSAGGMILIILCMFIGRLGPLTLILTMGSAAPKPSRRYPEESVIIG